MYSIDVCVDAKRCSEGNLDKFIRETAYELNCSNCYMTYEQTEKKKPFNLHCIFNIEYDTEHYDSMIEFIKIMKQTKYIHIECIFNNKIIHFSSYYLKEQLHKKQAKSLKKKSKKQKLSVEQQKIVDLLKA